jgi:hypothetical protein
MFVQVIKGRAGDGAGLREAADRWDRELRPQAIGYLGGTFGIADDGTFFVFARFADEASAAANSARPEQRAWWDEASQCIDGDATFRESSDVALMFDGGSDAAGFVQVMEGTVTDRARADSFESPEMLEQLRQARPDLLGAIRVWFEGNAFAEAAYFTSEEEAREGESSSEFSGPQEEYTELFGEMTFTDLRDPQLTGPA